jgi:hypothetical protein
MVLTVSLQEKFALGLNFDAYLNRVKELAAAGQTSGAEQKPDYIEFTKLNVVRMERVWKTTRISPELAEAVAEIDRPVNWLVITESWCGDAAQITPILARVAALSPMINLRFVFRDDNPDLMDSYLTGTSRSIPKMVAFNPETGNEVGVWGPRPAELQAHVMDMKADGIVQPELGKNIQLWYAKDKTVSTQAAILAFLQSLG